MLKKIDELTVAMFHRITKMYVWVTGRDNFTLSLLLFRLARMGAAYVIGYSFLEFLTGNIFIAFMAYWIYLYFKQMGNAMKEVRGMRDIQSDEVVLPTFASQMQYKGIGTWFFVAFTIYAVIDSGLDLIALPLMFLFWFAAEYVALDFQSPGKSLKIRALNWIKAHPIKLWSPVPSPNPMPS